MKTLLIPLLCLWMILPAFASHVSQVHDGDSFHVLEFKPEVRIFGIDAPEVAPPPGVLGSHGGQPFAIEARDYLAELLLGREVQLDCNHGNSHRRPVCQVFCEGNDVAFLLVKQGLAFDEPHFTHQYEQAEQEAKAQRLGVWSLPQGGERPWDWRQTQREKQRNIKRQKSYFERSL